ncbi:hypothetical protein K1719_024099 [Acacia pycnantha]|nr:hypothetical protein K1719_024099 [Acacia pycnantha]
MVASLRPQLKSCADCSEEELSVLPRHTKVVVTRNNRTKSVLVGLQGVVEKAVGLGGAAGRRGSLVPPAPFSLLRFFVSVRFPQADLWIATAKLIQLNLIFQKVVYLQSLRTGSLVILY